jgi:hypothetical protein
MTERYWATLPPEQLATELMTRWQDWRRYFWASGIGVKAEKGRRYYFGLNDLGEASSRVQQGGDKGQYLKMVLNEIRPIVQRSLAMIGAQAPVMAPVAANSDADARQQAISSRGILEHVHREEGTAHMDKEVLEGAMTMGDAARLILWDATLGNPNTIDPETKQPTDPDGDFANHVLTPFDWAMDPSVKTRRNPLWLITRTYENRWEWAARLPEKADRILAARENDTNLEEYALRFGAVSEVLQRGDMIPIFRFFHVSGAAIREGRVHTCLNEGTWLEDGANPYRDATGKAGIPVVTCTPGPVSATALGYTNVFDALGVQDLLNAIQSVIASHTIRWGVRPIVDFAGSGMEHSTLGNGTTVLTVKSRDFKPEPLDVPPIPAEVFKEKDALKEQIMGALGMNPTAAGNPPFAGMPAQMAALLDQKARDFNDGLSTNYTEYLQKCATWELNILKAFAKTERFAMVQGKASQWMLKSFSGDSLKGVSRVAMEPVPAGTGTMAWKWAMAELLQKFGVQLAPEQLVNLMRTGEYESPFEYEEANRLRIQQENEGLLEGVIPPMLLARTHWLDIREHLAIVAPPGMAEQPRVVEAVMSTIAQKLALWRAMPPDLLALMDGPAAPSTLPPPMPEQGAPSQQEPQAPEGATA